MLAQESAGYGEARAQLIVGIDAPGVTADTESAKEILNAAHYLFSTSNIRIESEESADKSMNLVLIGGPVANTLTSYLVENTKSMVDWYNSDGDIEVISNAFKSGKYAIIVAGKDRRATADAAVALSGRIALLGHGTDSTSIQATTPAPTPRVKDFGDFYVYYSPTTTQRNKLHEDYLKESKILEDTLSIYNDFFVVPYSKGILIGVMECGQENAYYVPDEKAIVYCYELLELFAKRSAYFDDQETQSDYYRSNLLFALNHELGHALIDIYDLPVLGKEEDAADQVAALFLSDDPEVLVYVAMNYLISSTESHYPSPYWDEHALDEQRYYNLLCWAYGTDPQANAYIVEEGHLPSSRANRCQNEYNQIKDSWFEVLDPYMIK